MTIYLASQSPRRREILKAAGYEPIIIGSFSEIDIIGKKYSKELVCECAKAKSEAAYNNYFTKLSDEEKKDSIIVTSDTVVVNNGIIYGKPKDKDDAVKILRTLSGKAHIVATAICLVKDDKFITDIEETKVYFKDYGDKDILEYIESSSPFDKAGSYGIQDAGFTFVEKIEGNLDNVIGFPMKLFKKMLNEGDKYGEIKKIN